MGTNTELLELLRHPEALASLLRMHSEASLGRLLMDAVHDLRNPLNSLLSGAQLLAERGEQKALRDKLLPVMVRASQRMSRVLDALDLPGGPGTPDAVDVRTVTQTCLTALQGACGDVQVTVGETGSGQVFGPVSEIHRLVLSLLQSHLERGPGRLWVTFDGQGDLGKIVIEDDGEPETGGGAGLPLLLQSTLARSLGGELQCAARVPCGSRSTLLLPSP